MIEHPDQEEIDRAARWANRWVVGTLTVAAIIWFACCGLGFFIWPTIGR